MNKKISVLLLIVLLSTNFVFAQALKQSYPIAPKVTIEQDRFEKSTPSNNNLPHNISAVLIDKMWNGYSTQASYTNQIHTDPYSGLIAVIHRVNRTGAGSGRIVYNLSDDGGANWTSAFGPMNRTGFVAGRHPNIVISNPTQATDVGSQAIAGGWADLGATWRYLQFSVDQAVGTNDYKTYVDSVFVPGDEMFTNDMGHIFATWEYDGVENPVVGNDTIDYVLFKSTDGGQTWTSTVILKYSEIYGGINGAKGFINKNGIGYIIIEGQDANGVYNIAYKKTTDHGNTWSETWTWVNLFNVPGLQGKVHSLSYEVDMVVDSQGRFHFVGSFTDTNETTDFTGLYHVYGMLPTLEAKRITPLNTIRWNLAGGLYTLNECEFATDKDRPFVVIKWRDLPDTSIQKSDLFATSWVPGQTSYQITNLTNTPGVDEKYSQMSAWGYSSPAGAFRADILYTIFGDNDANDLNESELWYLTGVTFIPSSVSDDVLLANNYELSQNYPNPFNPTTSISYTIPEKGLVTLKVYNIMGQEVATLVNEVKERGSYKVTFDASKLTSGVYLYTLKAGNFTSTKKMILVK